MQAAFKQDFVSVDDYLAGEPASQIKHEYIAGAVYAMAGGTTDHNQIAINFVLAVRPHLRGTPCRVFALDVKVRLKIADEEVFYYPDVMIGCDPRDTHKLYLRFPKVRVEVTSDSTERLDSREEYLIVAQDRPEVTIFRRAGNWRPEVATRLEEAVPLNSIGLTFPLSAIYEGVIATPRGASPPG